MCSCCPASILTPQCSFSQPLVIYFLCHLGFTLHYLVYLWYGYSGLKFDASLEYWGALISSYWLWVFLATWITAVDNLYRAQTFMNTHAKDYRLRSGLLYRPLVRVFVCIGLPVCLIASVIGVTVPLNKKWSSVYREAESFDKFMTLVSDIGEPPSIDFQRAAVLSLWQRWSRVWWLVSVAYGVSGLITIRTCSNRISAYASAPLLGVLRFGVPGHAS